MDEGIWQVLIERDKRNLIYIFETYIYLLFNVTNVKYHNHDVAIKCHGIPSYTYKSHTE